MIRSFIIIVSLLFVQQTAVALSVPQLKGRINDNAGVISNSDAEILSDMLEKYESNSGAQIFILTVSSIEDASSIEEYSIAVADKWKAGQKGEDNGVILVLALNEHKVRIEVGYGLEGVLTDAICGRIIRDVMVPRFREGNYSKGIYDAVASMLYVLTKEPSLKGYSLKKVSRKHFAGFALPLFIVIFMLLRVVLMSGVKRSGRQGGGLWLGGTGFGGGGFSGGFGGGGGGGFGGGGASGSW